MRKITSEAAEHFLLGVKYSNGNTFVTYDEQSGYVILWLHGNEIARRRDVNIEIRTAGWPTTTTKERLNGLPGVQVYHKNKILFLNGKPWENHEDWTAVK